MKEVLKYENCFVCGDKNHHGLKARFFFDGRQAVTEIIAGDEFEGYRGIFHGGIISSLLDEVMIKAILADEIYAVTAEMTIRYVAPARTGDHIKFTGKVTERRGKLFITEGQAVGENGQLLATATGKYLEAGPQLREELKKSIG